VFDVDEIKKGILKHSKLRAEYKKDIQKAIDGKKFPTLTKMPNLAKRIKDKTLLTDPVFVNILHPTNRRLGISQKVENAFFKSPDPKDPKNHPNVVFDVTLKDVSKLSTITVLLKQHGYDPKNIHLVWVVNSLKNAKKQNKNVTRGRVVPDDILLLTHEGAAETMATILKMSEGIKKYMDGDIWIVPNKMGKNSRVQKKVIRGDEDKDEKDQRHAAFFDFFDTYQIKKVGGPIDLSKMMKRIGDVMNHDLNKELVADVPSGTFKL